MSCVFYFSRVSFSIQPRRTSKLVVTLNPSKFAEKMQRRFHFENRLSFEAWVALHNQSSPVVVPQLYYNPSSRLLQRPPYPPNTAAFLYYCTSPGRPRIAGEIRLRVASSDDYASFEIGSDLLGIDGRPWSRSLCTVSQCYIPLYEKLREEGFVPDDLNAVLSTFTKVPTRRNQEIYLLNDPFIVDFTIRSPTFTVVTEQGMNRIHFIHSFVDCRTRMLPYTGASKSSPLD